jgi:hypothetical protein
LAREDVAVKLYTDGFTRRLIRRCGGLLLDDISLSLYRSLRCGRNALGEGLCG